MFEGTPELVRRSRVVGERGAGGFERGSGEAQQLSCPVPKGGLVSSSAARRLGRAAGGDLQLGDAGAERLCGAPALPHCGKASWFYKRKCRYCIVRVPCKDSPRLDPGVACSAPRLPKLAFPVKRMGSLVQS